jgi:hypothetical protein
VVAAVLLSLCLTGCGESDTESYCQEVRDRARELKRLSGSVGEGSAEDVVADALATFRALEERAPDDVSDEWTTFVIAWEGLADALERDEPAAVRAAAAELREPRVVDAALGIEQHARDVCDTDLGTGGLDF